MRKIDNNKIDKYVQSLCNQKKTFIVENKRKVNSILIRNKAKILNKGKETKVKNKKKNREVINLFSQVAKNVNQYIVNNGLKVRAVKSRHSSTYTNRKLYREMAEGERFFYVDISHCFWRIAYLKKYITKQLYENTLQKEEFKVYRNIALACIVAPRTRRYYVLGKFVCEISEWKVLHQRIYDNIRFTAYNLMGDLRAETNRYCIGYRTDGIMITDNPKIVKRVKETIERKGFSCKVTECYKVDDMYYQSGNNEKLKRI